MSAGSGDGLERFLSDAGPLGVLLDFDGSLSPIVARPELARALPGVPEALDALLGRGRVVAVISGRPNDELEHLVGVPGVRLLGLYGLDGEVPELDAALRDEVVAAASAAAPGARCEFKGASIAVHVRGLDDPDAAQAELTPMLARVAAAHGMEVIAGKRVLELVPAGRPLKDGAVERVVREEGLRAVLYAGDDLADLSAFDALDRLAAHGLVVVRVAVRGPETPAELIARADVVVDGPEGLRDLLEVS